jgi:hypothetical protein
VVEALGDGRTALLEPVPVLVPRGHGRGPTPPAEGLAFGSESGEIAGGSPLLTAPAEGVPAGVPPEVEPVEPAGPLGSVACGVGGVAE